MRKKELSISIEEFEGIHELPPIEQQLLEEAEKALDTAYPRYSNFSVGASLLLENDTIVVGSNQENVAFPSSMCAERVAMWKAATDHPGKTFKTIALTSRSPDMDNDHPLAPCGGCRQVMIEYEQRFGKNIRVIFKGGGGTIFAVGSIRDLLPVPFEGEQLRKY